MGNQAQYEKETFQQKLTISVSHQVKDADPKA